MLQQFFYYGEAIQARHLNIEKYHIRMVSTDQVNRLNAVLALGDDLDSSRRVEEVFELLTRKPFIVDDQRSHWHVIAALPCEYIGSRRNPGQCGGAQDWKARRREGMLSEDRLWPQ